MIAAGLFHAEIAEVRRDRGEAFLRFAQTAGGFQPMAVYSRLEASFRSSALRTSAISA
jgi:hypothetical protein